MLKSKDLALYFKEHANEREVLVEQIQSLTLKIKNFEVKCDQPVPEYLIPQFIKDQQQKFSGSQPLPGPVKVLVQRQNVDFRASLKRRLEMNDLSEEAIKKKQMLSKDKFVYINPKKEEGEDQDPSNLQVVSSRKLWKLRHGHSLVKRNRRLEKKGIFTS